jgi:hypothetical protein
MRKENTHENTNTERKRHPCLEWDPKVAVFGKEFHSLDRKTTELQFRNPWQSQLISSITHCRLGYRVLWSLLNDDTNMKTIQRQMLWALKDDELVRIWKKTNVNLSSYHTVCPLQLGEANKLSFSISDIPAWIWTSTLRTHVQSPTPASSSLARSYC